MGSLPGHGQHAQIVPLVGIAGGQYVAMPGSGAARDLVAQVVGPSNLDDVEYVVGPQRHLLGTAHPARLYGLGVGICRRFEAPASNAPGEHEAEPRTPGCLHGQQSGQLGIQAGLLKNLPGGCLCDGLAALHAAGG